jgi:cell division protein FtsB
MSKENKQTTPQEAGELGMEQRCQARRSHRGPYWEVLLEDIVCGATKKGAERLADRRLQLYRRAKSQQATIDRLTEQLAAKEKENAELKQELAGRQDVRDSRV